MTAIWKTIKAGLHEATIDGERRLYISRTRTGWEYGQIINGEYIREDDSTRPIARVKQVAERLTETAADPRPGNPEIVDDCIVADGPGNNWGAGTR